MFFLWICLVALVTSVTAARDGCAGFRITSPIIPGQHWTYGQCYSVDWDLGDSKVISVRAVHLVNNVTQKSVVTLAQNIQPAKGTTGNIPLVMPERDRDSGYFYFGVDVVTPEEVCRLNTVVFHLNVNPNSLPASGC